MDLLTPQFTYQFILEEYFSLWYSHSNPVWTGTSLTWSLSTLLQHKGLCSSHHNLKKKNYSSLESVQTHRERSQDKDELINPTLHYVSVKLYATPKTARLLHSCTHLFWFDLFCLASAWKDVRIHLKADEMSKIRAHFSQLLLSNFVILVASLRSLFEESNVRGLFDWK